MIEENLSIVYADTGVFQATLSDQAGAPINDAGAVYEMTAKRAYTDADAAAIFKVTASQATPGVAFLTVAPANTASLTPLAVLLYDIRVKETGGRVTTISRGTFSVLPAVLAVA